MKSIKKLLILQIAAFVVFLAADLLSKHYIMNFLQEHTFGSYVLIEKVLTLRHSINEGAGFGIFEGKKLFLIIFTAIAIILILALLVIFNIKKDVQKRGGKLLAFSLVLILAGGVGNLTDRIAFGYVRDFIEYTFVETLFNHRFAICNIADVELTIGMVLLLIYVLFFYHTKKDVTEKTFNQSCHSNVTDDTNIKEALIMFEEKYKTEDGIHGQQPNSNVEDECKNHSNKETITVQINKQKKD